MRYDKYSRFVSMALGLLFASALALSLFAQGRKGPAPMYNPATEVTLKGTVEAVTQVTGPRDWGGTHLTLKTDKDETFDVHVGPSWYLTQKGFSFKTGDAIEVTGSKIKFQGKDAVIAREIKKGEATITLRDEHGIPMWSRRYSAPAS